MLQIVVEHNQAVRSLPSLDQRHRIGRAMASTCPAWRGAAILHGVDQPEVMASSSGPIASAKT